MLGVLLATALPAAAAAPRIGAYQDAWPVWSPDGTRIAFTRIVRPTFMQLEVVNLRTHAVTFVAQSSFQLQPSWSQDGTRLAYQAGGSVYVADLRGGKRRIGPGGAPVFGKGSELARVIGRLLYVGAMPLTGSVLGRPAWSPDGGTIAFRRDGGIYTTDCCIPGTDRLLVGAANPGDPVYAPDGAQLAFTVADEVWVASRGLVPAHAIARAKPGASTPSWAPDGGSVVYTWRGGLSRTTLAGQTVLLHPAAGLGAGVSPASGAVAFPGPRPLCPGHVSILVEGPVTGTCEISGTPGADVIDGTSLWGDVILAGGGNDLIHANDRHTDRVFCGPGRDTVWADRSDKLVGCEVIHR